MDIEISKLIGEATAYDKKRLLERNKPKSWLKSVSAFANGDGGTLLFGISDENGIIGLVDAEKDAEDISEAIKTKLDPVPAINLEFREIDGKKLVVLNVFAGQETPYYYIGDKQRIAYVRIGNETVVADRLQLKNLVMKGSGRTYDSLSSSYKFEDMAFSKLKSVHYKRLKRSFEDGEFVSWGIIDEKGYLTNAGVLLADESPMRQSRIFCTRWNGLTMTSGLNEAVDDVELEGCVIGQLQDAVSFVRNNSKKRWWKVDDYREELPDYPERAVTETIVNAIIHRDYMQMGSEIHIDMYDNRLEVYSPGGMVDGRFIQQLDPLTVPSKRRNPLLADFFHRLGLMERRGSGMKKIIEAYRQYEHLTSYHVPEFASNISEFHVTLWNLNFEDAAMGRIISQNNEEVFANDSPKFANTLVEFANDSPKFANTLVEFANDSPKFAKEFVKATRRIYKLISQNPQIKSVQMAENMGLSPRQVQKYLRRLQDLHKIERFGGRKTGGWKIIDEEYEGFFDRI